jgi:aspartate kinase
LADPAVDNLLVQKFGGTSVADADAIHRVTEIVGRARARDARPVVVTSAMGGVTDALLRVVGAAVHGELDRAHVELDATLERHRDVASQLLGAGDRHAFTSVLDDTGASLAALLRVVQRHPGTRDALHDEIVSHGELLSSRLLALALQEAGVPGCWVDARDCVKTDGRHARAAPLSAPTEACTSDQLLPRIGEGRVPVLGGFIGSTLDGATTTLGRGGSDFTAALVGAALRSREIEIWTDVNGFLTADPRVVPEARTIGHLSYAEAAELAYFGAKVLHPRTLQPAVELGLPVRIRNAREPEAQGTIIDGRREASPGGIKAIAHKRGITVVQVTAARMLGAYGFLRALFEVFERHRTPVDIVATSEVSVSLTVEDASDLPAIVDDLTKLGDVQQEGGCAIVCVVGEGLRSTSGVAARVFGALHDLNIVMISQGASTTNLTFVVPDASVKAAVRGLHETFFRA